MNGLPGVGVVKDDEVTLHKGEEGRTLTCESELRLCPDLLWLMDRFIGYIITTNNRGKLCLCSHSGANYLLPDNCKDKRPMGVLVPRG